MNALDESRPLWRRAAASVMVCNPLLLLSPMCLLYGIYKAVTAPNLFAEDFGNTLFNFVALALYVLLVCVTSTLLARKRIIPDATMLLLLHALLFVSPFILIAHGVFLEGELAWALGWIGMSFGLAQLWLLRHRLPETFASRQLVFGGAFILAANFATPMIFRSGLENEKNNNEVWGIVAPYAWNLLLPLLAAWMNALPSRATASVAVWARPWFGFLIYFLWVAGTSIQLWTVAYVDDRSLHAHQFTAVVWVLAWTVFRRAADFPMRLRIEQIIPAAIVAIPMLGAWGGLDLDIACVLFALNIPLAMLTFGRAPAWALAGLSFAGAMCCLPFEGLQWIVPGSSRFDFVAVTLASLSFGGLAVLRDSRAGFIGAVGIGVCLAQFTDYNTPAILNAVVLFLFLHQLRWGRIGNAESFLLFAAGVTWMIATFNVEVRGESTRAACMVATVAAALSLRNASLGLVTSLIPSVCAIFVLLIHPTHVLAVGVAKAPSGLLGIMAGFALLGIGAWHSLRRAPVKLGS